MEFESLISAVTGGGLVLALSWFLFIRLIRQVDILADKVDKIAVSHARLEERAAKLSHLEDRLEDSKSRIMRLEMIAKVKNH